MIDDELEIVVVNKSKIRSFWSIFNLETLNYDFRHLDFIVR